MSNHNVKRTLDRIIPGIKTSDGAGVKLRRSIGAQRNLHLDPFLMLDEFGTENPDDYIAGFPPHPHRGFETVTYMLDGHMRHEDHLGNVGELKSGGVQWMTAGRGVIHSEMPQQEEGRMRGFQLWINLPAAEKMKPAAYQDIPAEKLPLVNLSDGNTIKVVAGKVVINDKTFSGPINPNGNDMATEPLFVDVNLADSATFKLPVPAQHTGFIYVYEGEVEIDGKKLAMHQAGILSHGSEVEFHAKNGPAKAILLAGKPLHEPVAQYGPFVMNTREEIEQALADHRDGTLTA